LTQHGIGRVKPSGASFFVPFFWAHAARQCYPFLNPPNPGAVVQFPPKRKESSAIAGLSDLADPDAKEAICPLCGRYGYVDKSGYCVTDQCSEATLDYARRERPDAIIDVCGVTVLLKGKLHRYAEPTYDHLLPAQDEHRCAIAGCDELAKPKDSLCNQCRRKYPKKPKARANTGLKHRPFAALRRKK